MANNVVDTLTKLFDYYKDNININTEDFLLNHTMVGLVFTAIKADTDTKKNSAHKAIRNFIIVNKITSELIEKYLEEYEYWFYEFSWDWKFTTWTNRLGMPHREAKDADGLTLPAKTCINGSKKWYYNGKQHRNDCDVDGKLLPAVITSAGKKLWIQHGAMINDDVDEYGNTLPTEINDDFSGWHDKFGGYHRDELGKNPNDENFGKTLPAIITATGKKLWMEHGNMFRKDVDEYGNTLPTETSDDYSGWNCRCSAYHRVELGKNPNDENFGKFLPTIITNDGKKYWYLNGTPITQEELTNKMTDTEFMKEYGSTSCCELMDIALQ